MLHKRQMVSKFSSMIHACLLLLRIAITARLPVTYFYYWIIYEHLFHSARFCMRILFFSNSHLNLSWFMFWTAFCASIQVSVSTLRCIEEFFNPFFSLEVCCYSPCFEQIYQPNLLHLICLVSIHIFILWWVLLVVLIIIGHQHLPVWAIYC